MLRFKTHGKWILAGEHSVLRGGTALVFPVASRSLDFYFEPGPQLKLEIQHNNSDLEMAFWGVLEKALQTLNLNREDVKGSLRLVSNIPVGAGMGASATLCVSLAKWLTALGHLKTEDQFQFSKELENLFHGESSGVDVAVALNNKGLSFQRHNSIQEFEPLWKPHFYLSYCGKRGVTADCISRVQSLIAKDSKLGSDIDEDMQIAVNLAKKALLQEGELSLLQESLELANHCFLRWGLLSSALDEHMAQLRKQGALACKPTGSGDGGFVLSLWGEAPQSDWAEEHLTKAL